MKKFCEEIYAADCIRFGEFQLKSGIISPVYCDFRRLVSFPHLLWEIGHMIAKETNRIYCNRVAGIPYAGVPIAVVASLASGIPMIYPRKEVKSYGTGKLIEGEFNPGETVLIIDDVITDGASKIEAIAPLKEAGLVVDDVLIVLDREQGGDKILAKAGYKLHSLFKLTEVIGALVAAGKIDKLMESKVREFLSEHQFA